MTLVVFLKMNGYQFKASNEEAADCMIKITTGDLQESDIEFWLKHHIINIKNK